MNKLPKPIRFLASIRLAVIIIIAMAILTAVGTIVEAQNDAEVAGALVYHSWYMYLTLGALCVCLIAVMVDRWPWKPHHMGFVLAHIGILILLFGAWLTKEFGIDGSMVFEIGQERKYVAVKEKDIAVYASVEGTEVRPIFQQSVDFISQPPTPELPFVIDVGSDKIEVLEYLHFAFRQSEMRASDKKMDGPAVRFQLQNPRVNLTEWLRLDMARPSSMTDLGPARVVIASGDYAPSGHNEIVLRKTTQPNVLEVKIFNKDKSLRLTKLMKQGDLLQTGWMGLEFRLLRYLPHAHEVVTYSKAESHSPLAQPAIRLKFLGNDYWLGLNSMMRLYEGQKMIIISYGQRQIELPFALRLKEFKMDKYQGTQRASSYESMVDVPGRGVVNISMNEPLYEGGYTFYQSSFEQDDSGKPVASILSVNHDPGRWIKYLGSFLICLGSIMLFYFKRMYFKKRG